MNLMISLAKVSDRQRNFLKNNLRKACPDCPKGRVEGLSHQKQI
jgi:hypothetical protein